MFSLYVLTLIVYFWPFTFKFIYFFKLQHVPILHNICFVYQCYHGFFSFAGAVTPDTTRFWYNNGYSNENYTQDNYIPIFQEDISDATIAQTNDTCGDNKLCQYDTIILGPTVGSNTKQEYEKVKNKDKIKGKALGKQKLS